MRNLCKIFWSNLLKNMWTSSWRNVWRNSSKIFFNNPWEIFSRNLLIFFLKVIPGRLFKGIPSRPHIQEFLNKYLDELLRDRFLKKSLRELKKNKLWGNFCKIFWKSLGRTSEGISNGFSKGIRCDIFELIARRTSIEISGWI